MVGHTAVMDAVVKAVETIDECVNDTVCAFTGCVTDYS